MRFIATADWHLTENRPSRRVDDDWLDTLMEKVNFIIDLANKNDAIILHGGDVFDSYRVPYSVVMRLHIDIRDRLKTEMFFVYGQHDIRFHNLDQISYSPLHFLSKVNDKVRELWVYPKPLVEYDNNFGVCLYGASFGQEIPIIKKTNEEMNTRNILVTHRMIVDEKLWEGQTGEERGSILLRTSSFDYIISGDNHQSFEHKSGSRRLFNCGSLARGTSAQFDFSPSVVLFEPGKDDYQRISIPITPAEKAFNTELLEREREDQERYDNLVVELKNTNHGTNNIFSDNLNPLLEGKKERTKEIVIECMEEKDGTNI